MKSLGSIVAAGMRTAAGLGAVETAFLLRTGIPTFTSAPLANPEGEAVTMSFDHSLDPYLVGEDRAARLGSIALNELVGRIGGPAAARSLRVRVALAFPESRSIPGQGASGVLLASSFRDALRETFGSPEVDLSTRGGAGLAYVLPPALAALNQGKVDAVLAGGVHTDYDPAVIASLAAQGRLFSSENTDSVMPGEAAAFVLITRDDTAQRMGCEPMARVHAIAAETGEVGLEDRGRSFESTATANVIGAVTRELPEELKVGWAVVDTGFEHARVRELYAAVTRTHKRFGPPLSIDSPAQRIGNLGAAAMGVELGIMSLALDRGFAPFPFGIALAASDGGERGAVLLGGVG